MKIAIIVGTRPEIIKMSPIIRACVVRGLDYLLVHTGQHYSYTLDKVFFDELNLPDAHYNLEVGSGNQGEQVGKAIIKLEEVFLKEKPDVVLVQGDTNSVLAGALAASKLGIKVGHVEAGLRSYDNDMPEEINRKLTDHMSDFLFCPTSKSREIALGEGIDAGKVFVTGNTIVDAVFQNLSLASKKVDALSEYGLEKEGYVLVTLHRKENVDVRERLASCLEGLGLVSEKLGKTVFYPMHPRTKKMISDFGISVPNSITVVNPIGFLEFLQLQKNASLVLTDSGGIQEESCVLKVPCVTLRENTERPETLDAGSNMLAGTSSGSILECAEKMISKEREWENPFGDGKSSEKILDILLN